jgi:hypothetical protein
MLDKYPFDPPSAGPDVQRFGTVTNWTSVDQQMIDSTILPRPVAEADPKHM